MEEMNYLNPNDLDDELSIDLKKIFFSLWSKKWLMLKIGVSIFALVILSTFFTAKKYVVDSDLYINKTNSSNMAEINPYFISEVGTGGGLAAMMAGGGNLMNEIELMQSPLVIDKVIQENDIRVKKWLGIFKTKKYGQYVKADKFMKKGPKIEVKKGTNVVTISYKSKDRELAYNVVNSIIKNYTQLHKELNTEKSKADKAILQAEYDNAKASLNKKMNSVSGLPQTAVSGSGGIAALSAISKSANRAMSSIQGQYASGIKSEIALREDSEKVAELAKKLEWAKLVDNMSDSSNVVVLKEPRKLQDYEQQSPKLLINIILGIVFGVIGGLGSAIISELLDKKLSYSMLGDEIIYDIEKDFIDLKSILLANKKEKISVVVFEKFSSEIATEIQKFNNINFVKADISEEFESGVSDADKIILTAKVGQTDSKLYKKVKQLLERMNKKVIAEVLV